MKIPICDHILHPHCLAKWLIDFQKCPVCEANIVKLPPNRAADGAAIGALEIEDVKRDEEKGDPQ